MELPHETQAVTQKINILNIIEYFPGFDGFNGGGAPVLLERLVTELSTRHKEHYHPHVYIGRRKDAHNTKTYPFSYTEDPGVQNVETVVQEHNSDSHILHFGSLGYADRYESVYRNILNAWKGPIVQRIPLLSRFISIREKHKPTENRYFEKVDVFISQSIQMTNGLLALGIPMCRIEQIENGIDCSVKSPLTDELRALLRTSLLTHPHQEHTIFLYAARLHDPVKGVLELLKVWTEGGFGHTQCSLILAGDLNSSILNSENTALKAFLTRYTSQDLRKHHILFTGLLSETELEAYYKIADVYITPSMLEGFSNSSLEALAWGLPIIGRMGVSGHEELIVPEVTGLLFENTDTLSRHIHTLAKETTLRHTMRIHARTHAYTNFSIDCMVQKYMSLYKRLLNQT